MDLAIFPSLGAREEWLAGSAYPSLVCAEDNPDVQCEPEVVECLPVILAVQFL